MGNGDLLKLSQDFHKKIDANDTRIHGRLTKFGENLGKAVTAIQSIGDQVQTVMNDRPCAEVKAAARSVEDHVDDHKSVKKQIVTWVLSVSAFLLGAYLVMRFGWNHG